MNILLTFDQIVSKMWAKYVFLTIYMLQREQQFCTFYGPPVTCDEKKKLNYLKGYVIYQLKKN